MLLFKRFSLHPRWWPLLEIDFFLLVYWCCITSQNELNYLLHLHVNEVFSISSWFSYEIFLSTDLSRLCIFWSKMAAITAICWNFIKGQKHLVDVSYRCYVCFTGSIHVKTKLPRDVGTKYQTYYYTASAEDSCHNRVTGTVTITTYNSVWLTKIYYSEEFCPV